MQPPVIGLFESPPENPHRIHKRPRIYYDEPSSDPINAVDFTEVAAEVVPREVVESVQEITPSVSLLMNDDDDNDKEEEDAYDDNDDKSDEDDQEFDEEADDDEEEDYEEGNYLFSDVGPPSNGTGTQSKKKRVKRSRKTAKKRSIPPGMAVAMREGTTSRQRQVILEKMILALAAHPTWSENEVRCYCIKLENRVYAGLFGKPLDPSYNYYRSYQYRRVGFELLGALRSDGGHQLVMKYPPDVLAALPGTHLCLGTSVGAEYEAWKTKREDEARREMAHRQELKEATGEGWYRCFKCGGKFEVTELQMRGGDEPATIFRTCQRCGFTKRS
jgi:hypothetical protein